MVEELLTNLQRLRMMALLRRISSPAEPEDHDALLLIGLAVGLVFAAKHPEAAAAMLVDLDPPDFTDGLDWVVGGLSVSDPDLPVN